MAAEQGDALAQTNLGVILAQRWYRYQLQGTLGDALAEVDFGLVQQDLVLAFMWFTLAAAQGNETAETNKGRIEEWLTPDEITEAQRLSQEWIDTHPQDGGEPSETIRTPSC